MRAVHASSSAVHPERIPNDSGIRRRLAALGTLEEPSHADEQPRCDGRLQHRWQTHAGLLIDGCRICAPIANANEAIHARAIFAIVQDTNVDSAVFSHALLQYCQRSDGPTITDRNASRPRAG